MKYRVKLYGHTATDPETFCRNLATALDVGIEDSRLLLRQAPVTIADEIDEKEAESLQSRLASIKALCILEPTGEDSAYQTSAKAETPTASPAAPLFRFPKDDSLRWLAWFGVLAVLAGIFVVFLVASFTSTYLKLQRVQPASPGQAKEIYTSSEALSEDQIAAENAELAENIIARIDTLERELPALRVKLREAVVTKDFPKRGSAIVNLENEIRARHSEIRILKLKLQGLSGLYEER